MSENRKRKSNGTIDGSPDQSAKKPSLEESDSKTDSSDEIKEQNSTVENISTVENQINLATFMKCIEGLMILHNGLNQQPSVSSKLDWRRLIRLNDNEWSCKLIDNLTYGTVGENICNDLI